MFEPSPYSYAGPDLEVARYTDDAQKEAKLSAGLAKASAGVAATAAVSAAVAPPWSLIVTAAAAATSLGIQVASKMSGRNAKALSGDQAAIAPFIRRAGRMKAARRKHEAERLLKVLEKHEAHPKKTRAWKVRNNVLKMKLGALYAAQQHGHENPHTPIEPGAPSPAEVEAGAGDGGWLGIPYWGWGLGIVVGGGAIVASRRAS